MLHLPYYVTIGIGIPFGLIYFALLALLWTAVAGPLQEWLCELTLDRWHAWRQRRSGGPAPAAEGEAQGPYAILISDIHMDTWQGPNNPKQAAFMEFLDWICAQDDITDLYINGDICDMPPFPLNQPDVDTLVIDTTAGTPVRYPDLQEGATLGVFHECNDSVFARLATLARRLESKAPQLTVTYSTGNHDIGISGLRYVRPDLPWGSIKVAWNPSLLLKLTKDFWMLVEHGHQHDPFLWIYLRYALLELLRDGTSAAQRGGAVGQIQPANAASSGAPHAAPGLAEPGSDGNEFPPPHRESLLTRLVRLRYRQAARRLYRMRGQRGIKAITFGHTHLPDRYRFPGGWEYVNSGDWAGNDDHQCYLKIYASGRVTGPHQWQGSMHA
jgi:hypothetical protein